MKTKAVPGIMLTLLVASMLTLVFEIQTVSADVYPTIRIEPATIVDLELTPGKNFSISIYTDYNGSDVSGYEFILYYNPLVLEGVEVVNGDLINDTMFISRGFDNEEGILNRTSNVLFDPNDPYVVTSGPGTLASVTFEVVGAGESYINLETMTLAPTRLVGLNVSTGEIYTIIDDVTPDMGHILHGYFRNVIGPIVHDIAVVSVIPQQTSVIEGESVNVTVIVENQGTAPEKCDVEVYYDCDPDFPALRCFGMETGITLVVGGTTSLTFTWNTIEVVAGNHTITAVASISDDADALQSNEIVTVHGLLDCYTTLVDYFNSLNSTYRDVLSTYDQLQSDYYGLKSKNEALTDDLDTTRNMSYVLIVTTIVLIATTAYLVTRRPKAKTE